MKESAPQIRAHRFLGLYCVLHSTLIFVAFGVITFNERLSELRWVQISWITFASLWFVWPIALLLHRGRSFLRVTVPLVLGYAIYFFWSAPYSRAIGGPERFGLSWGVDLTPHSIAEYFVGYGAGWAKAKKDAGHRLNLEAYGFGAFTPGAPNFSDSVLQQYHIDITHVTGCLVNEWILGHAKGYNEAMIAEIKRRFGSKVVTDAEEVDRKWQEAYATANRGGRADAERDVRSGHLAIEVFARSKQSSSIEQEPDYKKILRERYDIEIRQFGNAEGVHGDATIIGHANGYNDVIKPEIERRFGSEAIKLVLETENTYSYVGYR